MNNGNVVHFEDSHSLADSVKRGLELFSDGRHKIVGGAANLAGSLAVLDQIASGEVQANVVMFDGNLGTGNDALAISAHITELGLPVRTIGAGGHSMEDLGVEVDVDLTKRDFTVSRLVEILDSLDDPASAK